MLDSMFGKSEHEDETVSRQKVQYDRSFEADCRLCHDSDTERLSLSK